MRIFENSKEGAIEVFNMIIQEYTKQGLHKYAIIDGLSTIFLAGAPGAGKTEFLETVLDTENFIVIDIDKYRQYFKGYNGKNADLYQDSCSRVATYIFDYCIKNNLKLIFDGTLTSEIGLKNIKKALKKNRKIGIALIYQDPVISYAYTIARQERSERKVDIDTFLRIYYSSIRYVFEIVEKYPEIQFVIGSKNKKRDWRDCPKNPEQFVVRDFSYPKLRVDFCKERFSPVFRHINSYAGLICMIFPRLCAIVIRFHSIVTHLSHRKENLSNLRFRLIFQKTGSTE